MDGNSVAEVFAEFPTLIMRAHQFVMNAVTTQQVVRGLQSSVTTVQESMGSAMAGVTLNMERSVAMMDTMNSVMEQYLTESVKTGS